MDVTIGWPGKVHDARVLVNSNFYHCAMAGQLLPDWKRVINGVEVPLLILGDPAYPLLVSGCCCKEVYKYPHNITYPYSTCISSLLQQHPHFFVHF